MNIYMTPEELEQIATTEREAQAGISQTVNVCVAAGCLSCQSQAVKAALEKEVIAPRYRTPIARSKAWAAWGSAPKVRWSPTSDGTLYKRVTATMRPRMLDGLEQGPVERLLCRTDVPFFQRQQENCSGKFRRDRSRAH